MTLYRMLLDKKNKVIKTKIRQTSISFITMGIWMLNGQLMIQTVSCLQLNVACYSLYRLRNAVTSVEEGTPIFCSCILLYV